MSDLISRSSALKELEKIRKKYAETGREVELVSTCEKVVRTQPTAYNVEKVVQQLEQNIDSCSEEDLANCKNTCCRKCRFERIKRIVSNGGKE